MTKYRRKSNSDAVNITIRTALILAFFGYGSLARWWNSIPPLARTILLISLTFIAIGAFGLWVLYGRYRRKQRALAWKRAMTAWNNGGPAKVTDRYRSVKDLSDKELEQFAASVYAKMGYRVRLTGGPGDHGVDVYLRNPKNGVEVVQCKQWTKVVGEPELRDFHGAMGHEKAEMGWFWAPSGFSRAARRWVKSKPIQLLDDNEIERLINSVYSGN